MVRIDLSARRICRLDVVVALPDDESDFGREADIVGNGDSAAAADAAAAAAMSDTPFMCCRNSRREGLLKRLSHFLRNSVFCTERMICSFLNYIRDQEIIIHKLTV